MALIKEFDINSCTKLYLWHTVEALEDLYKGLELSETCVNRLDKMKSDKMKSNFLAVRQLIKIMGYNPKSLFYNSHGKPFLEDKKKISVSHSHDYVAVIISDKEVGLDIEKLTERVLKVAYKYTNWDINRSSMSYDNSILKLTKIWTAKESLYKTHNTPGLSLRKQINIRNFFPSDIATSGRVVETDKITHYDISFIQFEDIEDYIICYCFKKLASKN